MEKDKPSLEEVIKYATPIIKKFISEFAANLPEEQKKEVMQDAYLRLVNAYEELDPELGWKSFTWTHAHGAVHDYLRYGRGFHEDRWTIKKEETHESVNALKINTRLQPVDKQGNDIDVGDLLGTYGKFTETDIDEIRSRIDWDLVARMASVDESLHAFAMTIRDFSQEEIAPKFAACRTSIGSLIQEFINRFDDPEKATEPWFMQTCRAFGLSSKLNIHDVGPDEFTIDEGGFLIKLDQGRTFTPVDLDDLTPLHPQQVQQEFNLDEEMQ